jgi:hypothetical protein
MAGNTLETAQTVQRMAIQAFQLHGLLSWVLSRTIGAMLRRRTSLDAEALLDAYREGVAALVRSLRECELTMSHVARAGGMEASAKVDGLREVQRELSKRLADFDRIELGRWQSYYHSLDPAYRARDTENRANEARVLRGELP